MKLMQGGSEPATKEDLRNLEATMLAGFETCTYLLNCIILNQADANGEMNMKLAKVAADKVEKQFSSMLSTTKARILSE